MMRASTNASQRRPPTGPGPTAIAHGRRRAATASAIVNEVIETPGQPLEPAILAQVQARFGHNFSRVRIHTDARAAESARIVDASAYTVGNHVVFAAGRYAPQHREGMRLLAHELTHAVQQRQQTPSTGAIRLEALDGAGERGAEHVADAMAADRVAPHAQIAPTAVRLARSPGDETRASVHQRVLQGMIKLVKDFPTDGENRLEALAKLFESVPEKQVAGLYHRLQPGARTDDFAQYFKEKFPSSRAEGLSFLRHRMPVAPAPGSAAAPAGGEMLGKSIAVAGCSLPAKDSGSPFIRFGLSMEGDGYLYNPKYWIVEYTLVKNNQTKTFTSSKSQPSAWKQTAAFLEANAEWHGATLNIRIKVGQYGASAAISDVWNVGSAQLYAIDCLGAATLVQLRGIYLSYPKTSRDEDFDRDYGSFKMERFGDATLPSSSLEAGFDVTTLDKPIKLADQATLEKTLKPGDQVPISNPFMPEGPWRTENTIYVGNDKFFGHPFGVITRKQYAEKLAGQLNPQKPFAERVKFVLDNAYVASFSRARTRTAGQRPGKAGTPPAK